MAESKSYDDRLKFEHDLINRRLTWLLTSQSILFAALAFVLGTRAGDPNAGSQGYFAPSSHYMPPFMRVNPILEWSYGQVWHFLRVFSVSDIFLFLSERKYK